MNNAYIVKAIKYHRENLDFTSKEMAHQLNIGLSTYSKLENDERNITTVDLYNISKIFKMTMEEIITKQGRRK
ncbi:helix-turn-helix domain-containing protein [Macrococcus armenti]|uniref:helix-turn-helix transcriptional regulator n=1 Tax=Macrococcus armenti TaxID=2875764 RepID=UPI001CCB7D87|nr:helix-turn-helix transcriptional regulator [Macrococcus armenti]UBH21773.1 helix-turn-helix domain-containing protein [Macrococcus armenti]